VCLQSSVVACVRAILDPRLESLLGSSDAPEATATGNAKVRDVSPVSSIVNHATGRFQQVA
jgi:hypothetical protein